jgi:hypothetical protein
MRDMTSSVVMVSLLPAAASLLMFSLVRILAFRRYSVLNLLVLTAGLAGLITWFLSIP